MCVSVWEYFCELGVGVYVYVSMFIDWSLGERQFFLAK